MNLIVFLAFWPAYLIGQFFMKRDPGESEQNKHIHRAIYFGILSLVLTLLASSVVDALFFPHLLSTEDIFTLPVSGNLLSNIAVHAAIEECMKFIPLAVYVYKKPYFNELTDGIIYFAAAGLTFGVIETVGYALLGGGILTVIYRFGMALFLHGALTSIGGYALARKKLNKHLSWTGVCILFLGMAGLHTLYNTGILLSSSLAFWLILSACASIIANAGMFILFYKACHEDYLSGRTFLLPRRYRL